MYVIILGNFKFRLAGIGEAAAMLVLQKIGASKQPIQNLSKATM
jgi:hypothetical protein